MDRRSDADRRQRELTAVSGIEAGGDRVPQQPIVLQRCEAG